MENKSYIYILAIGMIVGFLAFFLLIDNNIIQNKDNDQCSTESTLLLNYIELNEKYMKIEEEQNRLKMQFEALLNKYTDKAYPIYRTYNVSELYVEFRINKAIYITSEEINCYILMKQINQTSVTENILLELSLINLEPSTNYNVSKEVILEKGFGEFIIDTSIFDRGDYMLQVKSIQVTDYSKTYIFENLDITIELV